MCKKMIANYEDLIIEGINNISNSYYRIVTTYKREGIIRERALCYELYHQIRLLQEENKELSLILNGEIDKRGHEEFQVQDRRNPDFIFHLPGGMQENTLVIEIKGALSKRYKRSILKDFETLIIFIEKYNYKAGYFILFNYSFLEFLEIMKDCLIDKYSEEYYKGINGDFVRAIRNIKILCKKDSEAILENNTLKGILKS